MRTQVPPPPTAPNPTSTPENTATATATPSPQPIFPPSALRLNGQWVNHIVADRLSTNMYAFTGDHLFRTESGGQTWRLISLPPQISDFVMNALDPAVLYSRTHRSCAEVSRFEQLGPIYKSTDGGSTWGELPGSTELMPLFSYAFNSDIVVATDCYGIFVSTDGGINWAARPDDGSENLWESYIPHVVVPLYSRDASDASINGVEAIYAGGISRNGSGLVAFTRDLGRSWTQVTPDLFPSPWGLSELAVDWLNPGQIWFTDAHGVWRGEGDGLSWSFSNGGLKEVLQIKRDGKRSNLTAVSVHPTGQIYLGTIRGLYAKGEHGSMWHKVSGMAFDDEEILDIFYIDMAPSLLYISTPSGVYVVRIVQ